MKSCLQDIRAFVLLGCLFSVFHQAVTSGLVSAVLSTLELRYGLSSVQSGALLSTYNVTKLIFAIPMSYLLGKGSIPRNMGLCCFIVAVGCFLFAGAELLSTKYVPAGVGGVQDVCSSNPLPAGCDSRSTSGLYYLLLVGQGVIALGAAAPYCICPAFITNNVPAKQSLPLLGFFFASLSLGPAVGFLGGGALLGSWVDPSGLPEGFEHLTSDDAQWVGNWWLGILVCGVILLSLIPFFVFIPARLPTAPPHLEADIDDHKRSFGEILGLLKDILTSPPWWLVTLAIAFEAFSVSGYTGFGPKYIQSQFSVQAGTASIIAGGGIVPAAVIGAVLGGWWDGRKHDKLSQSAVFNTKMAVISAVLVIICVFFGCDNQPIVGFTTTPPYSLNANFNCNTGCNCDQTYAPVCGADGLAYFNPCLAGCLNTTKGAEGTSYSNCQCVFSTLDNVTAPSKLSAALATPGACKSCGAMLGVFMLFFFLFLLFTFMNHTPTNAILLRVVPSVKHKSLSLGLNDVVFKILGSIPGPLVFGASFDNNCILKTQSCGNDGSCAVYDNYAIRLILLLALGAIFKIFSAIFNFLSISVIKKQEAERALSRRTSIVFPEPEKDQIANAALDAGFLAEIGGLQGRNSNSVGPRLSLKAGLSRGKSLLGILGSAPISPEAQRGLNDKADNHDNDDDDDHSDSREDASEAPEKKEESEDQLP